MYGWNADFKLEGASNQSKDIMKAKAFPNLKSLVIKINIYVSLIQYPGTDRKADKDEILISKFWNK